MPRLVPAQQPKNASAPQRSWIEASVRAPVQFERVSLVCAVWRVRFSFETDPLRSKNGIFQLIKQYISTHFISIIAKENPNRT
jgi:hypothetical protein